MRGSVAAELSGISTLWREACQLAAALALSGVVAACGDDEPTLVRFVNHTSLRIDSMFVTLPLDMLRFDSIAVDGQTPFRRVDRATSRPMIEVFRGNGHSVAGTTGAETLPPGLYTFELTFTEHIVISLVP